MARDRLDNSYETIYIYLTRIGKIQWLHERYRRIWPRICTQSDPEHPYLSTLRGAFQPLADMWKDVKDTAKPYRTKSAIRNDALQPIYGVGHILKGCAYLVLAVPLFLINLVRYATKVNSFSQWVEVGLVFNGIRSFAWLIDGVLSIIRGATQLATTPLTWFIKMPLRGIITGFTDKKDLAVENRPGMQKLVTDAKNNDYGSSVLIDKIHKKYENSTYSNITPEAEIAAYKSAEENLFGAQKTQYLNLFQPESEKRGADPVSLDDSAEKEPLRTKNSTFPWE